MLHALTEPSQGNALLGEGDKPFPDRARVKEVRLPGHLFLFPKGLEWSTHRLEGNLDVILIFVRDGNLIQGAACMDSLRGETLKRLTKHP